MGSFPDARFAAPGPSTLRKVLDTFLGVEPADAEEGATVVLRRPFGMAAIEGGFVVADPDARAVLKVDWQHGKFSPVTCPAHSWYLPTAVATSPAGELYVADAGAGMIVRVEAQGRCTKLGEGKLERPTGVAVAGGLVYVVDTPRHQVVAFSTDGREERRFGVRGTEHGGLNFPTAITVAADGALLVVDALNFRIARFSPRGTFLGDFGSEADGAGAVGRPKGIAVDADGRIFVADAHRDLVLVYSPGGVFILAMETSGDEPGRLVIPAGVAVGDRFLYVANSYAQRVEIYLLLGQGTP